MFIIEKSKTLNVLNMLISSFANIEIRRKAGWPATYWPVTNMKFVAPPPPNTISVLQSTNQEEEGGVSEVSKANTTNLHECVYSIG